MILPNLQIRHGVNFETLAPGHLRRNLEDEPISPEAAQELDAAAREGTEILISPMTGWEIGMLAARKRVTLTMGPEAWFDRLLSVPGVRLAPLPVRTLIASSFLPGTPPRDPADRIIVATAREGGYRIVTRDRALLEYAGQGHVSVLEC
jgi:PIN domain nuclease of toxin-antitoxin system